MTRNILIVANHFPPEAIGGAEVVAHRQALALRERGFQVAVLAGAIPREGFESGSLRVDEVDGLRVYRLAVQSHSPDGNFHWPAAAGRLEHKDALSLMGQSDVAVLASVWPENEPVTMLEAISTGTAQLASRLGGNLELVDEDASGLMFPAGDAKALAAAMRRFVLEPDLATTFGAYNAARRDRFDERNSIDQLEQMLAALEPEPDLEEIVVLCVGDAPADDLPLAIHNLHLMETGDRPIRLVWHEWAGIDLWRQARLVWFWDGRQDPRLLSRALRYGIPVLAPEGSPTLVAAGVMGAPYGSWLDAMAWIASLQDMPSTEGFRSRAGLAARVLGAAAPRPSFLLPAKCSA